MCFSKKKTIWFTLFWKGKISQKCFKKLDQFYSCKQDACKHLVVSFSSLSKVKVPLLFSSM